jgi:hypothetical protein
MGLLDVVSYVPGVGSVVDAGKAIYNAGKSVYDSAAGDGSGVGGAVADLFTNQNANAGQYTPGDYQFGGDANTGAATVQALQNRGQATADQFALAGAGATGNAHVVAQGLTDAGFAAQNTGQVYARQANEYANAASDQAAAARQLGSGGQQGSWNATTGRLANFEYNPTDPKSQHNWENATAGLSGYAYQPSANSTAAMSRLNGYDAGPQGGQTADTYQALRDFAAQGPGPSAAENQLRQGQDANVAAQVALARSGRNAGDSAQAMRQAQFQIADIGQRTNADAATLRANEAANWRGQQMSALGAAGQLGATTEAQRQSLAGLGLQGAQAGAQLGLQGDVAANQLTLSGLQATANQYGQMNQAQMQANAQAQQAHLAGLQSAAGQYGSLTGYGLSSDVASQQAAQNWGQLALQGQQVAGQQSNAASQLYLNALSNAGQVQNQGAQLGLTGLQAGTAAQAGYDNAALGITEGEAQRRAALQQTRMSGQTQSSIANQQSDTERDQMNMGMISNGIGMIGRAFGAGGA